MRTLHRESFEHGSCGIGAVANIKGARTRAVVEDAMALVENMDHRGARGADPDTGDGAGILLQIPHRFFSETLDFELPEAGRYGVAMVFASHYGDEREEQFFAVKSALEGNGLDLIGCREVPTNPDCLGRTAYNCVPSVYQLFARDCKGGAYGPDLDRLLYAARKSAEKMLKENRNSRVADMYFCSFSSRSIVYKGMLIPRQLRRFYPDLKSGLMESAIALTHSRYSTNTFPSWKRAHPNRFAIHNGEINTIKGNVKWINSREKNMISPHFDKQKLEGLLPVIDASGSDSAIFDNVAEFLYMNGYPLEHAMAMMIPEPWENRKDMDPAMKAFYEYHSFLMEPWDGPAAMVVSDGDTVVASLDRNGLRPARYCVTEDDVFVLASEAGALEIPQAKIIKKGRLMPGKMLAVDTKRGKLMEDDEIKEALSKAGPYERWIAENTADLDDLTATVKPRRKNTKRYKRELRLFGYTFEDINKIILPMAETGSESIGAMGADVPLAVLSEKPQLLYNYFKQLFAQVTNPPIDAIREKIVIGTETSLGSDGNILIPDSSAAVRLRIRNPVLKDSELLKLMSLDGNRFKSKVLSMTYDTEKGGRGLEEALEGLFRKADEAVREGCGILILTDRHNDKAHGPIPALLAVSALNQDMVRKGTRTRANLVVETGEARETHHFAMLIGYGASAVNPYMVFSILKDISGAGTAADYRVMERNYTDAAFKGIVKIMSKMGISTVKGYRGAQIFECVGIKGSFVDRHFTGTESRIGGIGADQIAEDVSIRHKDAYARDPGEPLDSGGDYQYREGEEYHLYNPETILLLQKAARENDLRSFRRFSDMIDDGPVSKTTIRSLFEFTYSMKPVPPEEVEPAESILRRFKTGAMSYGSISIEAHKCLAKAMNRLGGRSNSGEGGEEKSRYGNSGSGDSECSAIKQIASGRFGVDIEYLNNAKEIQIKIAQGAKPGEGGQIPGIKVYPWIAETRNSVPWVDLISPPPHHDIYSIEDLGQLIHDLKCANSSAEVSVKLVSAAGVGTVASGVAKAGADIILISGYDGGTGAAPRSSLRHAGLPWELGLSETHQTLLLNDLRGRVRLETDGKLMTGRDVVTAALLGAEEYGFATAPLVIIGCVMMRSCNLDTCPVGIATQDPELRKNFRGRPEHVENYFRFLAEDIRGYMSKLGFRTIGEMIGRTDKLAVRKEAGSHPKYGGIDLSQLLSKPATGRVGKGHVKGLQEDGGIKSTIDFETLLPACKNALLNRGRSLVSTGIRNTDRSVGTGLSGEIARRHGMGGLPEGAVRVKFRGSAGQSFGAFLSAGCVFELEGEANDYAGKGLSGGIIVIRKDTEFKGRADRNIIAGNVALYGAIKGEAYFEGIVGERFCVRNSGAVAIAEGAGDHACEYMTGGKAVIIGRTGYNFAAGMSGGTAYVFDEQGELHEKLNGEMAELGEIDDFDAAWIKQALKKHEGLTGSVKAELLLAGFDSLRSMFRKVSPKKHDRKDEGLEWIKATDS